MSSFHAGWEINGETAVLTGQRIIYSAFSVSAKRAAVMEYADCALWS